VPIYTGVADATRGDVDGPTVAQRQIEQELT